MNLRTRITLMTSLCFVVLAVGLIADGRIRERTVEKRYESVLITGHRNAWLSIARAEMQRIAADVPGINRNDEALRALAAGERDAYAQALHSVTVKLRSSRIPPFLEIVLPDGELFFTTSQTDDHPQVLDSSLINAAVEAARPISGLVALNDGGYSVAVVFPLFSRSGPSGVGALYVSVEQLIGEFSESINEHVFFLKPDGSLAHGTEQALWWKIRETLQPRISDEGLENLRRTEEVFAVARIRLADIFERPSAVMVTVRDITASYWRELLVGVLSYGLVATVLALFLGSLQWYMRASFRPLNSTIRVLNALSRGDTTVSVPTRKRSDEIGRLAGTVEAFRQAQQAHSQLNVLRQELDVAKRIQGSIRPSFFPDRAEFRLFAELQTAREVGGDFFDFFDLPDGRFGFVMADVSGKGMGAALYMAVARTVIRTTARIVPDPGACLERANDFLSSDNDESMFVTVFYAVLEPDSGRVVYANAGHNPPYRIAANGAVTPLEGTEGMALGVMGEIPFQQKTITLAPGEQLFLYTDGVTEAIDPAEQEFTERRLEQALADIHEEDVHGIVQGIVDRVVEFADTAPQADDITCMGLAYRAAAQAAVANTVEFSPAYPAERVATRSGGLPT